MSYDLYFRDPAKIQAQLKPITLQRLPTDQVLDREWVEELLSK
jgi:hypothetical protein